MKNEKTNATNVADQSLPVSMEVATAEMERWLDHKKVGQAKRESNKDFIETLINGVSEGVLEVGDDCKITHNLKFPLEGEKSNFEKLVYLPRLNVAQIKAKLRGVKANDTDGRMAAYAAAICQQNSGLIDKLDTEDNSIVQAITIFFV